MVKGLSLHEIKNSKLFKFLLLVLIGVLAHYPSFNLSLYGDDWLTIYLYFVPDGASVRFGQLPGVLTYLTPYGPSIFLIGTLYTIFQTNYVFYYIVALLLRVIAAFALCVASEKITNNKLVSFLVSLLFLVGYTGLQTTDWVFYMNVYLAIGLLFISTYFQFKFFDSFNKWDFINQFLFLISSIIIASVRLFPLILIIPLIEISFLVSQKGRILKITLIKIMLFSSLILSLWLIGLFGGPGKIYSPDAWSIKEFLEFIIKNLLYSINSFLHLVGVIVFPSHPSVNIFKSSFIGTLFVGIFILGLIFSRKDRIKLNKVIIGGLIFFIFSAVMWFYLKLRLADSADRYLLLPFAGACVLIGILSARFFNYFKMGIIFFLIMLIGAHFLATKATYESWLSNGRDQKYIQDVHGQIIGSIPLPLTKNDIIYLDFDDMAKDQSVVFGLGYKILVLSNTLDDSYHPNPYDNNIKDSKFLIIEKLKNKISQGLSKEDLIERVFSFELKQGKFKNTTTDFRKELSGLLSDS